MRQRLRALAPDAVIAAGAAATFARSLFSGLVPSWDDGRFFLTDDPDLQEVSGRALASIWTEEHFQAFHPLHLMSYWLDVPWAGPSGPVMHATNLVLFVLALALLRRVFGALGLGTVAATLATLLVAVHPVQVESVAWATGRKEILALGFSCGAALAHLRRDALPAWARWTASPALYVCAILSKTTALPVPLVLLAADVIVRGVPWRRALAAQVPAIAVGVGVGALVARIWTAHDMIRGETSDDAPGGSVALVGASISHYLRTAAWPSALSPVYPIRADGTFGADVAWGAAVMAAWIAWAVWRKKRRVLFAAVAFLLLAAPVLNVVPVYFQFQDRYLSLPLVALAFGAGAAVDAASRGIPKKAPRAVLAACAVVLAALAARTVGYQLAWSSDDELWLHATRTHPTAFYAWMKLGELRRDRADLAGALAAYDRAIEAAPSLRLGHSARMYALALRDERRHHLAPTAAHALAQRYHAALDDAAGLRELATEMIERGYRDAALDALGRSLDLDPVDDARLVHASNVQRARGNAWLADFYERRMRRLRPAD